MAFLSVQLYYNFLQKHDRAMALVSLYLACHGTLIDVHIDLRSPLDPRSHDLKFKSDLDRLGLTNACLMRFEDRNTKAIELFL